MRPVQGKQGRHEIGVIGHTAAGHELAELMAEQIRAWEPHREEELSFSLHFTPVAGQSSQMRRVLKRTNSALVVSWGEPT